MSTKNKNKFLKKKYTKLENLNNLLYFSLSCTKANEIRKLRRQCVLNKIHLIFLPSSFAYTSIKASHGPSIVCALTKNASFNELSFAHTYQAQCFSLKNRGDLHPLTVEKQEHSKAYAIKTAFIFHTCLKKLEEKNADTEVNNTLSKI